MLETGTSSHKVTATVSLIFQLDENSNSTSTVKTLTYQFGRQLLLPSLRD